MNYIEDAEELLRSKGFYETQVKACTQAICEKNISMQTIFRNEFISKGGTAAEWADVKITFRTKPSKGKPKRIFYAIKPASEVFIIKGMLDKPDEIRAKGEPICSKKEVDNPVVFMKNWDCVAKTIEMLEKHYTESSYSCGCSRTFVNKEDSKDA